MFAIFLSEKLNPFYQNIASVPTVFFTVILAVVVLYWLLAVLGLVEIDVLDFDFSSLSGDTDFEFDAPDLSTSNVLAGLMLKWGLYGVPVTVIVSFIALFGWLICYYLVYFFMGSVPQGALYYATSLVVLIGALHGAVLLTALLIKPLRPLFKKGKQDTLQSIIGQTAVVRTSKVNDTFGEAVLADGGAGLILKVRTSGETEFVKGDRVVLFEYVPSENYYRVIAEVDR